MAPLAVENWDDDEDLQGFPVFNNSLSTVKTSISSRLSLRSESNAGDDDWQVPLSANDEQSTSKAITSAKQAGIPLPANVPASALVGGSIKRLGNKKPRTKVHDEWDEDIELPDADTGPLKLRTPKPAPSEAATDFDDFTDGSLGIRTAGRRESKNRSSSASAMSPSMGSCLTFESEEDGLDGLVIPTGAFSFQDALRKRKQVDIEDDTRVPTEPDTTMTSTAVSKESKEDLLDDLDLGPGEVFEPQKRTLNRNIKTNWKQNKEGHAAIKTQASLTFTDRTATRLPRPVNAPKHPRLEPVFENGATPPPRSRRPEATTTSAQLLRSKRSMPALPSQPRPMSKMPSVPYLNPNTVHSLQSQQKQLRSGHQSSSSDPNRAMSPTPRPQSRLSAGLNQGSPVRTRKNLAPTALAREAASKKNVTRPARRHNFGDGTELDMFDDLPTSTSKETKYTKPPSGRGPPKVLRSQASQSRLGNRENMVTPMTPSTPKSPTKEPNLPRFARDTAASRIAREQTLGGSSDKKPTGPLTQRVNWPAQVAARTPHSSPSAQRATRKGPQLINPMGKENIRHFQDDAAKKGMHWNASKFRWEGNEHAVASFEPPAPPSPSRPALITNMAGATQGVQVVGGMVFDPQRMCWLKMGQPAETQTQSIEDDDDPFRDIEDLKEAPQTSTDGLKGSGCGGDWLVGEEFDLGPEFIKRQREEETLWRSRVGPWFEGNRDTEGDKYKWTIRDIAATVGL
ncbi:MAG: hypothetical protein M1828_003109 [Chrysothrix sp. TS-e1954]|nr:MAG: hypothetical protein M1828_003109 [Chrysothrix sp. TS-e1954]